MAPDRNRYLILNYVFIGCLIILVLNDHLFKATYSNIVTGKLSDAVGIIMLPLLLTYLFPSLQHRSVWVSAVLFTFWKSPLSTALIDLYNNVAPIGISRVVDYTDLFVFSLLPAPYFIIKKIDQLPAIAIKRVKPAFVLAPVMAAFMASSPGGRVSFYQLTNGNLVCDDCYITLQLNEAEIIRKLNDNRIHFDSIKPLILLRYKDEEYDIKPINYYRIKKLVLDEDTLRDLDFTMHMITERKTRVYLNGMKVNKNTTYRKIRNQLIKLYWKKIFRELRDKTW